MPGVDRLAGADTAIHQPGYRRRLVVTGGMMVAGESMADQDRVTAVGVKLP